MASSAEDEEWVHIHKNKSISVIAEEDNDRDKSKAKHPRRQTLSFSPIIISDSRKTIYLRNSSSKNFIGAIRRKAHTQSKSVSRFPQDKSCAENNYGKYHMKHGWAVKRERLPASGPKLDVSVQTSTSYSAMEMDQINILKENSKKQDVTSQGNDPTEGSPSATLNNTQNGDDIAKKRKKRQVKFDSVYFIPNETDEEIKVIRSAKIQEHFNNSSQAQLKDFKIKDDCFMRVIELKVSREESHLEDSKIAYAVSDISALKSIDAKRINEILLENCRQRTLEKHENDNEDLTPKLNATVDTYIILGRECDNVDLTIPLEKGDKHNAYVSEITKEDNFLEEQDEYNSSKYNDDNSKKYYLKSDRKNTKNKNDTDNVKEMELEMNDDAPDFPVNKNIERPGKTDVDINACTKYNNENNFPLNDNYKDINDTNNETKNVRYFNEVIVRMGDTSTDPKKISIEIEDEKKLDGKTDDSYSKNKKSILMDESSKGSAKNVFIMRDNSMYIDPYHFKGSDNYEDPIAGTAINGNETSSGSCSVEYEHDLREEDVAKDILIGTYRRNKIQNLTNSATDYKNDAANEKRNTEVSLNIVDDVEESNDSESSDDLKQGAYPANNNEKHTAINPSKGMLPSIEEENEDLSANERSGVIAATVNDIDENIYSQSLPKIKFSRADYMNYHPLSNSATKAVVNLHKPRVSRDKLRDWSRLNFITKIPKKCYYDLHGRKLFVSKEGNEIAVRYSDKKFVEKLYDIFTANVTMVQLTCSETFQEHVIESMFKYAEMKYDRPHNTSVQVDPMEEFELYLRSLKHKVKVANNRLEITSKQKKQIVKKHAATQKEADSLHEKLCEAEEEKENALNESRKPIVPAEFVLTPKDKIRLRKLKSSR